MKYFTKEWYEKSQAAYCTFPENIRLRKEVDDTIKAYRDEYVNNFNPAPDFMKTIDELHDCEIVFTCQKENDYIFRIDNSEWGEEGFTDIILKNAVVLKQDFTNQELGWMYHELYKTENGYELHGLFFEYGSDQVYEFIAKCENIEIAPAK